MFVKAIIIVLLLGIFASLASGLFYVVRDQGNSTRAVRALTVRVALSVALFALLMLAFATGLISGNTPMV
ncbi:twin transmembrane helix small protein [Ectothiorhodospiraceae bacterium 2226]|nr:twin transmembrane helix small protein [Ectothiorhodospiraceae bacterium 2226]